MNLKQIIGSGLLLTIVGLAPASIPAAAVNDNRAPELPSPDCDKLQVEPGHKVAFHVYASGVQKYRWNGTSWAFIGPEAALFSDPNFRGKVGTHYGGPTWESNSGSYVIGVRREGCSVDPNAIDWLLLEADMTEGPGIFKSVTFIQRVNTAGGKAPSTPGSFVGEERRIPYTTEYYFYRAQD
jgi:hypothetical protein